MKVCFLLQRSFAYVGHQLAILLKEKYGINEFCGYVYVRDGFNFLKSQHDINYTSLLLDEDIHELYKKEELDLDYLRWFEREHGLPNLWPYIEIDRIVRYGQHIREYPHNKSAYSHEDMLKILQVKAKAIIKFLEKEKPDAVVFSAIGATGSLLLYNIAKKKGIKTIIIHPARIGIKQTLSEKYTNFSWVNEIFGKLQKNNSAHDEYKQLAVDFIKKFRENPAPYAPDESPKLKAINRMRQFKFFLPYNLTISIRWAAIMTCRYFFSGNKNDYSTIKLHHYFLDKVKRKFRVLRGFERFYDDIDPKEKFAFFPLHFEPETTLLLLAPFYTDQIWLIKQMARSLPAGRKLYIKEHPSMFGYRPSNFYKTIKKIPNVKLIKPEIEGFELLKTAELVFVIAGTAGWEASLLGKPVITFGNVFYNILPGVKKCATIEDMPNIVKNQIENFQSDEKSLVNFVTAVLKESADVDLVKIWKVELAGKIKARAGELASLADLISKKLSKNNHDS